MTPRRPENYLIMTKLHRPPLPADLVRRSDHGQFFSPDNVSTLTLVCAPAGYGKSIFVAQQLDLSDLPVAWISLDELDGALWTFLAYLKAAINQVFPDACEDVAAMLEGDTLPPVDIVAARLGNDLDSIDDRFILVLDDFHRLNSPVVPELLDRLLEYPPRGMQLVIATRRNPSLSLHLLRGRHLLREVRQRDLRFSEDQTGQFLEQVTGRSLKTSTIKRIYGATEGWPVALRLAAFALGRQHDSDKFIEGFNPESLRLEEYLLSEILDHQRPEIRDCLLRTSLLQRFCAPLCDELGNSTGESDESCAQGDLLIQALRESAMPYEPLDEGHEWFRLHHMFQEILERRLIEETSEAEIREIHRRAARWLNENGLVEDAIHHYLKAGDPHQAGQTVARHRQLPVNLENWHRIGIWLDLLPEEVVRNDAGLLVLQARCYEKLGLYATCVEALDQVEELLSDPQHGGSDHDMYQAWLDQERSIFAYHFVQPAEAIKLGLQALENLPEECASERTYAQLSLGVSYQMVGEIQKGFKVVYEGLEREKDTSPTSRSRLLQTLCWMHWMDGDLHSLENISESLADFGLKNSLRETVAYAKYFTGAAQYHLNKLDSSEESLKPLASDPFGPVFIMYMSSSFALSLIHEAKGRHDQARKTIDDLVAHMLETGNTSHLDYGQAHQAEIAMKQGRIAEALRWVDRYETGQATADYQFSLPDFIVAKILVYHGNATRSDRAEQLLQELQDRFEKHHNTRFICETLILRAVFESMRDNNDQALELLGQAVSLALPGGFIRLFVDMGPIIGRLLDGIRGDEVMLKYLGEIKAAFRAESSQAGSGARHSVSVSIADSLETLSKRELEVLDLLAAHMTNREIGTQLFISTQTVKRHANNIYQKLSVSSRREAVAKAMGLGILGST